ncbi:hypothetical protein SAMN06297251_1443 [Fulvimarina manganoxydans]|uniref:DUF6602 domain-containing protein n=1 Tax=Fulvimarina manganoxydans TaxID=937218 RepID=A0A1W2EYZ0_9HYPH|nr:DUF6602 domain-containing protein [Fulvimarina manganoxydans]SMD14905.1 hypothetical protein SAMN06297251_1443 [Fulvimarina manganoxydans]
MSWDLGRLLAGLHEDIQARLAFAREAYGHPGTKGDATEAIWLELLKKYLPRRYCVDRAHVVDSDGTFSQQIDVVVYDRQYSPFVLHGDGQPVIPAESVYAVFEAKQQIDARHVAYAQEKARSVRKLCRTSLPIPHAGGVYPARALTHIIAGLLTLDSGWNPPFEEPIRRALADTDNDGRLDVGCVAAHGYFVLGETGDYVFTKEGRPATAFLFELIAKLQAQATVPMIDIRAYAKWLAPRE